MEISELAHSLTWEPFSCSCSMCSLWQKTTINGQILAINIENQLAETMHYQSSLNHLDTIIGALMLGIDPEPIIKEKSNDEKTV